MTDTPSEDKLKRYERACKILLMAIERKYYGKVEFKFESGNIVGLREEKVSQWTSN